MSMLLLPARAVSPGGSRTLETHCSPVVALCWSSRLLSAGTLETHCSPVAGLLVSVDKETGNGSRWPWGERKTQGERGVLGDRENADEEEKRKKKKKKKKKKKEKKEEEGGQWFLLWTHYGGCCSSVYGGGRVMDDDWGWWRFPRVDSGRCFCCGKMRRWKKMLLWWLPVCCLLLPLTCGR